MRKTLCTSYLQPRPHWGRETVGKFTFLFSKAWEYAQNCEDTLMIKPLPNAQLKSWHVNENFHGFLYL